MADHTLEEGRNAPQGKKPWYPFWQSIHDHVIQNKADIGALVGGSAPGWEAAIDTRWSFAETSLSAGTYIIAIPDAATNALYTGAEITVYSINQTNAGASTLNVGSTDGAVVIKKRNRVVQGALIDIEAGDLDPTIPARVFFDGTQWVLRNPAMADFLDEDDMASDSATAAPSQQSVKAFVANEIAAGVQIAVRATKTTTSQNITAAVITKVTFNTEDRDLGGDFASSTFTAPVAGRYLISSSIRFETTASFNHLSIYLYVNGGAFESKAFQSGGSSDHSMDITDTLELAALDTVEIYCKNQQQNDVVRSWDTWLMIEYLGT